MENYPSNSRHRLGEAADETTEPTQQKKIERVTAGEVVRRKKPIGKRFRENFIGSDAKSVWGFIVLDVLVPAAKDAVADATSQGIEKLMFGEAVSRNRRPRGYSGSNGQVQYHRMGSSNVYRPDPREPRREMSRRGRGAHDFDEIILETRGEAEEVIDRLFDLVSRYQAASVADLYELVGITANYTDNKWGWTDIRGAGVTRVRSGYLLDLPRPEPLD